MTALKGVAKRRYRNLALVALVLLLPAVVAAISWAQNDDAPRRAVIVERSTNPPTDVRVDPATDDVRLASPKAKRSSAYVGDGHASRAQASAPRAAALPGAPTEGYELAEPGDRTPPPPPEFLRALGGSLDDSRGAPLFASHCPYSHSRPDDPLVYPRKPGASHLHDFFGNKATDAYSTDDSLRDGGATTCFNFPGDSAAYWVPALYESGQRVAPTALDAYYTAGAKDHRTVEPFPRGLKMLIKDADAADWYCLGGSGGPRFYDNPPLCGAGEHLGLQIAFPDCWDGKYLDVPDHRKHVAYAGANKCPASHPVPLPQLVMFVDYKSSRGGAVELAPLSNPSSPHADFVNSWDQAQLTRFVRDCINAGSHCAGSPPG